VKAFVQRHKVAVFTPNADATSATEAIEVVTSCTAGSRRPDWSGLAYRNVASPNTNTTPPSASSNSPADGPTERALAGVSGNTGWLT